MDEFTKIALRAEQERFELERITNRENQRQMAFVCRDYYLTCRAAGFSRKQAFALVLSWHNNAHQPQAQADWNRRFLDAVERMAAKGEED